MIEKKACRNCAHWQGAVATTHAAACSKNTYRLFTENEWCRKWQYFLDQQIRTGEKKR